MRIASNKTGIEHKLLAAEPWLRPFADELRDALEGAENAQAIEDDPVSRWGRHALAARRTATVTRLGAGHAAWTRWVDAQQQMQEELSLQPGLLHCLRAICTADFRSVVFDASFDATGFTWPTPVSFAEATFGKDAWLGGCVFHDAVDFSAARFLGSAIFERSHFAGKADFSGAFFGGASEFRLCVFEGEARFRRARFAGDAWFRGSKFVCSASFAEAAFQAEAGLGACTFAGNADFSSACFADNAGFEESLFRGRAEFSDARFARNTWFVDNQFASPPKFERTHFAGRVHIDDTSLIAWKSPVHQQIELVEAALQAARPTTQPSRD